MDKPLTNQTTNVSRPAGSWVGVRKKSLSQKVYEHLLDLIVNKELRPGTVLQERQLCGMLNVSRTPAREALYRLESEDFLARSPGGGLIVKEISVRNLVEILHIRRLLESESVRLAISRVPTEELDAMEVEIHAILDNPNPTAAEDWKVDDRFHAMVARHSGNQLLGEMVQGLRLKTRIFNAERVPERFAAGHREHLRVIDCFRRGDREGARAEIERHIDNVKESILRRLSEI